MSPTDSDLRKTFLAAMSRAAATVSVVTTDGPAGRAGVTVSAMTSVSADGASPTMLACIHRGNGAAPVILANGCFCINVLCAEQRDISEVFAHRAPAPGGDKFSVCATTVMSTGAPRLAGSLAAFDCRLISGELVDTHHVFIGAVRDVHIGEGEPLLYGNRSYLRQKPHRSTDP